MKYLIIIISIFLLAYFVEAQVFVKPSLTLKESSLITKIQLKQAISFQERDDYIALLNKYLAKRKLTINGKVDINRLNALLK